MPWPAVALIVTVAVIFARYWGWCVGWREANQLRNRLEGSTLDPQRSEIVRVIRTLRDPHYYSTGVMIAPHHLSAAASLLESLTGTTTESKPEGTGS